MSRQRNRQTRFSPRFETENKLDLEHPRNLGFSAGPAHNTAFKYKEHIGLLNAAKAIEEAEERFAEIFGRRYTGLTERYWTEDADYILITLGSIAGLVKEIVDRLREQGEKGWPAPHSLSSPLPEPRNSSCCAKCKVHCSSGKGHFFLATKVPYIPMSIPRCKKRG